MNKTITVRLEIGWYRNITEESLNIPFNPYIFVNNREHEIHLPGSVPTSHADDSLRGTENDLREDSNGNIMYYISKDNMPFALHTAGVYFKWPKERESVLVAYPSFVNWRDSNGSMNNDWYNK